jgi:excisionase family DNA binding protein
VTIRAINLVRVGMNDELLTLGQAAKLIGCSRITLHEWVNRGKIEAITLPPAYRRKGIRRYVRRSDAEQEAAKWQAAAAARSEQAKL